MQTAMESCFVSQTSTAPCVRPVREGHRPAGSTDCMGEASAPGFALQVQIQPDVMQVRGMLSSDLCNSSFFDKFLNRMKR
jgi:hypothetical protein